MSAVAQAVLLCVLWWVRRGMSAKVESENNEAGEQRPLLREV